LQNIEPVDRIGRRAWGDSAKAVSERLRQAAPGLYFRCYKAWFYKTKYDREPAHQDDPNLRSLRQDGICVIPDFLNPEEVGTILQEAGEALRELEEFQDTRLGKATCMPSSGIYRLDDVERLAPASARFFSDPVIWRVARAFVSRTVTSRKRMLELRPPIEAQAITDTVHFDDWRIKFKAFLYLVDVDEHHCATSRGHIGATRRGEPARSSSSFATERRARSDISATRSSRRIAFEAGSKSGS